MNFGIKKNQQFWPIQCIVGYCYKYICATNDWFCGQGSHISVIPLKKHLLVLKKPFANSLHLAFYFWRLYLSFSCVQLWRLSWWTKCVRIINFYWLQSLFNAIILKPLEKSYWVFPIMLTFCFWPTKMHHDTSLPVLPFEFQELVDDGPACVNHIEHVVLEIVSMTWWFPCSLFPIRVSLPQAAGVWVRVGEGGAAYLFKPGSVCGLVLLMDPK